MSPVLHDICHHPGVLRLGSGRGVHSQAPCAYRYRIRVAMTKLTGGVNGRDYPVGPGMRS